MPLLAPMEAGPAIEICELLQKTQQTCHKIATAPKTSNGDREEYTLTSIAPVQHVTTRQIPMKVLTSITHNAISACVEESHVSQTITCDVADLSWLDSHRDDVARLMIGMMKEYKAGHCKRKWQLDVNTRVIARKREKE